MCSSWRIFIVGSLLTLAIGACFLCWADSDCAPEQNFWGDLNFFVSKISLQWKWMRILRSSYLATDIHSIPSPCSPHSLVSISIQIGIFSFLFHFVSTCFLPYSLRLLFVDTMNAPCCPL